MASVGGASERSPERTTRRSDDRRLRRAGLVIAPILGGAIGAACAAVIRYQQPIGGLSGTLTAMSTLLLLAGAFAVIGAAAVIAGIVHRTGLSSILCMLAGGMVIGGLVVMLVGPA